MQQPQSLYPALKFTFLSHRNSNICIIPGYGFSISGKHRYAEESGLSRLSTVSLALLYAEGSLSVH
jgi:hypothetical protein